MSTCYGVCKPELELELEPMELQPETQLSQRESLHGRQRLKQTSSSELFLRTTPTLLSCRRGMR